jgi:hypothetical protein
MVIGLPEFWRDGGDPMISGHSDSWDDQGSPILNRDLELYVCENESRQH